MEEGIEDEEGGAVGAYGLGEGGGSDGDGLNRITAAGGLHRIPNGGEKRMVVGGRQAVDDDGVNIGHFHGVGDGHTEPAPRLREQFVSFGLG